MARLRLKDDHYVLAKQMGRFLNNEILRVKGQLEEDEILTNPINSIIGTERIRFGLYATGILAILKDYQDYLEEDIATLLMIISEKSDTLLEEWAEIGKIIMAEMKPEPPTSGEIFEELYSPTRFEEENS
tara:strand:+ start:137 stop:526 length:390 start_codon:yes stop_codon:yes gene_type:complete